MRATSDAVIIGNPKSGRAGDRELPGRHAESLARRGSPGGLNTERPDHATELAAEAGERLVVAAGGDGTVNEVINGLSPEATLGILPLGTANVRARELGLPRDPEGACRRITEGGETRVDLGVAIDQAGNERRFACMAGVASTQGGRRGTRAKALPEGPAFQVTAFRCSSATGSRPSGSPLATSPRREVRHRRQRHYYGGDYKVTGPGLLTSVGSRPSSSRRWPPPQARRLLGHHLSQTPQPQDGFLQATEVHADSAGDHVPIQIDGELWGELPMSFRVEPAALRWSAEREVLGFGQASGGPGGPGEPRLSGRPRTQRRRSRRRAGSRTGIPGRPRSRQHAEEGKPSNAKVMPKSSSCWARCQHRAPRTAAGTPGKQRHLGVEDVCGEGLTRMLLSLGTGFRRLETRSPPAEQGPDAEVD